MMMMNPAEDGELVSKLLHITIHTVSEAVTDTSARKSTTIHLSLPTILGERFCIHFVYSSFVSYFY